MVEMKQLLSSAIQTHRIAGASMALLRGDQLEVATAGYANVREGIEVTPRTVFQIGSITKAFTALLMGVLVDEGVVDFDMPVLTYLPDLQIGQAKPPETLTVRSLLDHSCGFEGDFFADFGPDPSALERYVAACKDLAWIHQPGTMQSYNSAAYCIAGRVIEAVTGQHFNQALADRILTPLGMQQACFYDHDVARYRSAIGHIWDTAAEGFAVPPVLRLPHCMSASGASLTLSAPDLLRFGCLFLDDGKTELGDVLVSKKSMGAMIDPHTFTPPNDKPLLMSWVILETSHGALIATSGQTIHQNALLVFSKDHGFAAAILTNATGGANQLFESVLMPILSSDYGITVSLSGVVHDGEHANHEAPPEGLARYEGEYVNQTRCNIIQKTDGLYLEMIAQSTTGEGEQRDSLKLQQSGRDSFVMQAGDPPVDVGRLTFLKGPEKASNDQYLAMGNRLYKRV